LRQIPPSKRRKILTAKLGRIFKQEISGLSKEMQQILLDDLVTAYLNRLDVLKRENDNLTENIQIANFPNENICVHERFSSRISINS
jgi:BMFP domain-containing protein YqiC